MRFHLDEHMNSAIADGLRRRGIDVTTTLEAGLGGEPDGAHIEFANSTRRVIVTEDADFLALAGSGVEHVGIVYCHRATHTVGEIIEYLVLMDAWMDESEMRGHIEFC